MKDIKKLMITLVALLAVTTGAWAQGPWTSGDCTVTFSDGVMTVSGTGAMADYTSNSAPWSDSDVKTIVIESGVTSIGNSAFAKSYKVESVSIPASVTSIGRQAFEMCGSNVDALTVSVAEGSSPLTIGERAFYYANLTSIDMPNRVTSIGEQAFSGCSNLESVSIPASVTSISEEAFWNCGMLAKVYIFAPILTTYGDMAFDDNADGRKIYVLTDAVDTYKAGWPAYAADIVGDLQPLASGPKVAWDKATKTGKFTMPGGNVTLEPEYYPQAALTAEPTAINDVPATTDGAIVKAGTVANIGSTTTAQGTVMYYVSPTALDDAALLALAADAWTADVPTAAHLAQGQAYVYYYVRGNDSDTDEENFNDGDILAANALTVTIAAEPTYDVTYAEGTQDADKWTVKAGTDGSFQSLPLKGVKAGTKVKLKYDGDRSMLKGVKAVKKGAAPAPDPVALSAVTADYIGSVVTSDGNVYPAKTAVPAGKTAVGILGKVTETGHGLILALNDAPSQEWNTIDNWTSASYAGTTLKVLTDAARGTNLTSYTTLGETTVSNWAVAQKIDYEAIFTNLGSTTGDSDGTTYDANVNAYITTDVGGTAISGEYWSATMKNGDLAWYFSGSYWNYQGFKSDSRSVRPVLGF